MNRRNALSLIAAAFAAPAASAASGQADDTTRRLNAMKRAYEMTVSVRPEDIHKATGVYYRGQYLPLGPVQSITCTLVYDKDGVEPAGKRTVVEFYEALP
jgi:hypothetical protein